MNNKALESLTEKACASMRFRTRKEILEESPDIAEYLNEIMVIFSDWHLEDGPESSVF